MSTITVDLVYPGSVSGSENYSSEAPLGPIALYSSLPPSQREGVRFLDSTILSQSEIEQAVVQRKASVVALSCTTFNYPLAMRVASLAKDNGSWVVCGGIHVTHLRDAILAKMRRDERPVDFLVTGYGEPAFGPLLTALADGSSLAGIPNLSYVQDGRVVVNPVSNPRFGRDPLTVPLDYSSIDLERYSKKFRPYGNLSSTRIAGSTFTQRGCAYAREWKCTFCSIEQMNPRRSAELFEQDIITLVTQHKANHIRITDADFTLNVRHMACMAEAAERAYEKTGSRPLLHCFTRADEIDEERIALLKRLSVVSVFIGYESGSDQMLKVMQKHLTKEQNLRATHLLKEHGIDVICGGLVLGAEGECEETLRDTLQFAKELKAIGNTLAIAATPFIPLPGSPAFARLLNALSRRDPGNFRELTAADDFDIEQLVEIWNGYASKVPLPRLVEVCEELETLFRVGIRLMRLPHPKATLPEH